MKIKKIIIVVILIFIYIFAIGFLFSKKVYFSENEFRYLERIQSISLNTLITTKTFANIDAFIEDHFLFREEFIKLKNKFELLIGKKEINGVYITDEFYIEKYNDFSKKEQFIEVLSEFYDKNKDVDLNLMLVPTSYYIYQDYLDKYYRDDIQRDDILDVCSHIKFNCINVIDTFIKNKNKYQLYYKTDHHWTTYGAYLAYQEYSKVEGLVYKDVSLKKVSDNFKGSIYSKVLLDELVDEIYLYDIKDDIEVSYNNGNEIIKKNTLYNMNYLDKKDKYSVFLDNNNPLVVIHNKDLDNNKKILVLKDSYANAFVPFLVDSYQYIHVVDLRYYNVSVTDYIDENDIKEVLFLYNINTINDDIGIYRLK